MDSRIAGPRRIPDNPGSASRAQYAKNRAPPVPTIGLSLKAPMTDTHASHHGNRVEDFRLVTGAGKYAADWTLPGQLYAHFVRSDRAHAEIVSVDVAKAAKHPGVKLVYTGKDAVRAGYDKFLVMLNTPGKNGQQI